MGSGVSRLRGSDGYAHKVEPHVLPLDDAEAELRKFIDAAKTNNIINIRKYIYTDGFNINATNVNGDTSLIWAAL